MREVQRKKVEETKRDETEEEKRGDGRGGGLRSSAIIYRYCKSRAGGDVSKTKMPDRSLEAVRLYTFLRTFFIRGEWNTFSSSPPRTFK